MERFRPIDDENRQQSYSIELETTAELTGQQFISELLTLQRVTRFAKFVEMDSAEPTFISTLDSEKYDCGCFVQLTSERIETLKTLNIVIVPQKEKIFLQFPAGTNPRLINFNILAIKECSKSQKTNQIEGLSISNLKFCKLVPNKPPS